MLWISLGPSSHQWIPCSQVSALTISATETWLTVDLNQRRLLIKQLLQATGTVGWECHLFVIASCQSQLLITMYSKSRLLYLYLENVTKIHNKKTILLVRFGFIVELSLNETPHLEVSQSRGRWGEQPKTFVNNYTLMKTLSTPPPSFNRKI